MDFADNPIFADRDLTQLSTCETPPAPPKRPKVPPVIGEIIANLGLRYRPSSGGADLQAHAESLILLAEDCADVPPPLLDAAAKRWARENRWMPRASELRDLARKVQGDSIRATDAAFEQLQAHCDLLNASERKMGGDGVWHVTGEAPNRQVSRGVLRRAA